MPRLDLLSADYKARPIRSIGKTSLLSCVIPHYDYSPAINVCVLPVPPRKFDLLDARTFLHLGSGDNLPDQRSAVIRDDLEIGQPVCIEVRFSNICRQNGVVPPSIQRDIDLKRFYPIFPFQLSSDTF